MLQGYSMGSEKCSMIDHDVAGDTSGQFTSSLLDSFRACMLKLREDAVPSEIFRSFS